MFLLVTVYWLREPSGQWGKWGIFPSIPLPANKDGQWTLHGMCCWYEDMCWSNVLGHNNMQTQLSNLMTCTAYCINTDNDPYDLRQEMICCPANRQHQNPVDLVDWDIQDVWLNQVFAAAVFIRSCLPKPFGSVYKILSELQNFLLSPGYQGDEINWWQDEVIR